MTSAVRVMEFDAVFILYYHTYTLCTIFIVIGIVSGTGLRSGSGTGCGYWIGLG